MTKIQILSDLHTEFGPFSPKYLGEDVLVLAGDIQVGLRNNDWFVALLEHRDVVYVLGNHEYYHQDYAMIQNELHIYESSINMQAIQAGFTHRLYICENRAVCLGGVNFIGATLWTDFDGDNPITMETARRGMNDFHVIKNRGMKMTPIYIHQTHKNSAEFIEKQLNMLHGKKVVITHHAPSFQSVGPQWQGDPLNGCFASNLERLVDKADLWVHGHMHDSFDYTVGNGRVICNPRGYYPRQLNHNFLESVIEIL